MLARSKYIDCSLKVILRLLHQWHVVIVFAGNGISLYYVPVSLIHKHVSSVQYKPVHYQAVKYKVIRFKPKH